MVFTPIFLAMKAISTGTAFLPDADMIIKTEFGKGLVDLSNISAYQVNAPAKCF